MLRGCAEGERATHRAPRSVEGCENAVACAFHEISAMLLDRLLRQTIVTIEQLVPAVVSDFHRHTRGADDVGEKNGRQDPIRFGKSTVAMSGDEFLNVADQPLARSRKARAMGSPYSMYFAPGIAAASFRP